MAGFFLAFDRIDSGDENDKPEAALRLPSGDFDVPLMMATSSSTAAAIDMFDQFNNDGFIGDKFLVNGKIQPYFHVAPRKYRFRLLDAGHLAHLRLQLRYQDKVQTFLQIAADGNLLPEPVPRPTCNWGAAERADIVIDFSKFPVGAELFLSTAWQAAGRAQAREGIPGDAVQLLKFIVDQPLRYRTRAGCRPFARAAADQPRGGDHARLLFAATAVPGRSTASCSTRSRRQPKMGTAEIWNLRNLSGGWAHPIHIHFEEGRILKRNGGDAPAWERGRKDVYLLGPNESVSVFLRFRDFTGKYVMHCHNTHPRRPRNDGAL
jgi:FtsP/CotA-like multicopper oxidase with cupredoxin domain